MSYSCEEDALHISDLYRTNQLLSDDVRRYKKLWEEEKEAHSRNIREESKTNHRNQVYYEKLKADLDDALAELADLKSVKQLELFTE